MAATPLRVAEAFVRGKKDKAGAFTTDGYRIFSYDKLLAHKAGDGTIVYDYDPAQKSPSKTTSVHMKALELTVPPPRKARANPSSGVKQRKRGVRDFSPRDGRLNRGDRYSAFVEGAEAARIGIKEGYGRHLRGRHAEHLATARDMRTALPNPAQEITYKYLGVSVYIERQDDGWHIWAYAGETQIIRGLGAWSTGAKARQVANRLIERWKLTKKVPTYEDWSQFLATPRRNSASGTVLPNPSSGAKQRARGTREFDIQYYGMPRGDMHASAMESAAFYRKDRKRAAGTAWETHVRRGPGRALAQARQVRPALPNPTRNGEYSDLNPKIDIVVDGKWLGVTNWYSTVKACKAAYQKKHPGAKVQCSIASDSARGSGGKVRKAKRNPAQWRWLVVDTASGRSLAQATTKKEAEQEAKRYHGRARILPANKASRGAGPTANPKRNPTSRLDAFTYSYMTTALGLSTDDEGEALDRNYDVHDIAPEAKRRMAADCTRFFVDNQELLHQAGLSDTSAGHNFWLTRNHHGAGFWSRCPGEIGDKLTKAAHAYGESEIYVGDDGKLYV